jgi:16S rRNA (guanine966-N2)-methyltransferase
MPTQQKNKQPSHKGPSIKEDAGKLPSGKLRIIAGKWRGRKFPVPPLPDVRPTPNRIRETAFNWLAPVITDARCLDLFTGSGALGLEALSRGASEVVFIDQLPVVVRHIQEQLAQLNVKNASVKKENALTYLSNKPAQSFDIIFLDPPFNKNLIQSCCELLEQKNWLSDNAYLYIETESELDLAPLLPENWELLRSKKAGQVGYHLARRTTSTSSPHTNSA